ncbi:MAG: ABC transporter permease [Vampirovibrionales bacterium]|nr:ABC transporter permease [Vampirovibrionales bacterium]
MKFAGSGFLLLTLLALLMLLGCILIPVFGVSPTWIHVDAPLLRVMERWPYILGTDDLGRDCLSRLTVGVQISLGVGLLTAMVSVAIGTFYGLIAARFEGAWDSLLMRALDVFYSLPAIVLVIWLNLILSPLLEPVFGQTVANLTGLTLAIAFFNWPDTARLVRAQAMVLKREAYMEAAQTMGLTWLAMAWRHAIPNLASVFSISILLTIPRAILAESTLSFIGLGIEPPMASLGSLASDGWQLVRVAPHLLIESAVFLTVLMIFCRALAHAKMPTPQQAR